MHHWALKQLGILYNIRLGSKYLKKNQFISVYKSVSARAYSTLLTFQSEDDGSLSGVPLTALYFDSNSRLLISGDKVGMVKYLKKLKFRET